MDGYTVEEAASVLGVPRERVWELLARGILSGSTDLGGSMRVRLKSDSAAGQPVAAVERPIDAMTGASAELTPFRELLTEFRSLTERYGQALLALGEARGEVAGLRSRVDMLEARVDLRLPSSAAPTSSSWSTPWPIPTERVVEPPSPRPATTRPAGGATTTEQEEADASHPHDDEGAPHRRRSRAGRRATESFADALARAQDPSIPELPGAAETAAALAAMRQEHPHDGGRAPEPEATERDADASLPRELPSADQVPVAEEADVAAVAAVETAAEDAAIEEAAGPAGAGAPDHVAAEIPQPESAAAEPAPVTAAALEAEETPEPAAEIKAEPTAAAEEPGAGESEPAWDPERYSAAIEEPGWISADDVPVAPTDQAPPRDARPPDDEAPAEPLEAAADDSPAESRARTASPAPAERPTPAERQVSLAIESSGSRELDEGLAALDALAHPRPPTSEASEDELETAGGAGRVGRMEPGAHASAVPRSQVWARPSPPLATRSSASRAYRRLRRIFPT